MKLRKLKQKYLVLGLALAALSVLTGCGKTNIGYVDGERIQQEAPQIKNLLEEGNAKVQEAQEEAQKDLEAKRGTMTEEEFQKAQQEARRKVAGLSQSYSAQLKQKLDTALAEIAHEKSLDAVVENEGMQRIVVEGGIDVTDDAIAKLQ